jgi:Recombination endonuclease VII
MAAPQGRTPRRQKKTSLTYNDLRQICDAPIARRRKVPYGRHGELAVPRKFHLSDRDIADLRKAHANGNPLPNPHNKGFYFFFIETLKILGPNRSHQEAVVKAKFREITEQANTKDEKGVTFWRRWKEKQGEQDWNQRFLQNAEVLQRLGGKTPYGLRIKELGTRVLRTKGVVIDILQDRDGGRMYRLNTDSATPVNEFHGRRTGESRSAQKAEFRENRMTAQRGQCAICREIKRLVVDHCHRSGQRRGLLCHKCNSGLGYFSDSKSLLMNAITYLAGARKREGSTA